MSDLPSDSSSAPPPHADQHQIEVIISYLLRIGVLTSMAIIFFGMCVMFSHHADYLHGPTSLHAVESGPKEFPTTVTELVTGLHAFSGKAIIMLGLAVLIATPVMRVAISILGFGLQGDHLYVVLTSIVLALLLLSFVLGKAGG